MEKLERITTFGPAFHKIHEDPKQNYGVGSVKCLMVLKGEKGAVHFAFGTGIYLPQTWKYWHQHNLGNFDGFHLPHMGYDVGYCSPVARYENQTSRDGCDWLDGKPCFGDGSAMRAEEFMNVLQEKGSDEVWKMLEADYKELFEK